MRIEVDPILDIFMMNSEQVSRAVISNQQHVHEHLYRILQKHRQCAFRKPFSKHTLEAFAFAKQVIEKTRRPIILDSGCGTGESARFLARQYPNHLVLGIDKSLVRLQKNPYFQAYSGGSILILRAEMFDFWRLLVQSGLQVDKHFILYPNPWPKKKHLKRRIYGHPAFFDLLALGGKMEIRSNWKLYLQEFAEAVYFVTGKRFEVEVYVPNPAITAFERKYANSGHTLYRLLIRLT